MRMVKRLLLVYVVLAFIAGAAGTVLGGEKIDINKASADELTQLKNIGPAKAAAIVDYRTKNGLFKSVEELVNVKGIGDKLLAKIVKDNKDKIIVTSVSAKAASEKLEKKAVKADTKSAQPVKTTLSDQKKK